MIVFNCTMTRVSIYRGEYIYIDIYLIAANVKTPKQLKKLYDNNTTGVVNTDKNDILESLQ